MGKRVLCPLKRNSLMLAHFVLIVPLLVCGCYESQSRTSSAHPQSKGIEAISRFFPFSQVNPIKPENNDDASGLLPFVPESASSRIDYAEDDFGFDVAMPASPDAGRILTISLSASSQKTPPFSSRGNKAPKRLGNFGQIDLPLLDKSFIQLYSSIFRTTANYNSSSDEQEIFENPFTKAKEQQQVQTFVKPEPEPNQMEGLEAKSSSDIQDSSPQSINAVPVRVGNETPEDRFLIIGDLDGSGIVSATPARRSTDTRFVSPVGNFDFSLFVSYAALEQQSSFYIDDLNADGAPDFLFTSQASLFGGVFLGDGRGTYVLSDKFVTGYEPTVPVAGPLKNGIRELLTVNMRSGALRMFREFDEYQDYRTDRLPFLPTYLIHLVSMDSSQEFVMAAQAGGTRQILRWGEHGSLEPVPDTLGVDPLIVNIQFGSNSLKGYQVGNYASIVLTGPDRSVNIANFRVFPKVFLIIGDILQRGLIDVAIANQE